MTNRLNSDQIEAYRRDGFIHPIRVVDQAGATELLDRLEAYEDVNGPLTGERKHKSHLLFTWLAELVENAAILDAVESLYGADLLCWSSSFFIKEPGTSSFVSWHQDSTYWGLSRPDVVTAWVAFTPATDESGAMQFLPGSHTVDQLPHRDTFAADNLLTRGQEVAVEVDADRAVTIELSPGEMSLHHVRLVHGSGPNRSNHRRIGYAIRYIPTSVAPIGPAGDSALLVRGSDRFGHFEPEQRPVNDLDPAAIALHHRVTSRQAATLFTGTDRTRY